MLNRAIFGISALRGPITNTLRNQIYRYSTATEKWEIYASVCLERLPVVTPPLNDMQTKYQKFLDESELTDSFKSDHEIRMENDIIVMKKFKNDDSDLDPETINKVTAQDFEDASNDEFASFKFAPIETDADKNNDQKSLDRKLQSHLVLLVEQELGAEKKFVLPLGKHKDGESLRQTAERVFKETCGDDMDIKIFGNAPFGYYRYKLHNNKNAVGAKVFFYYANPVKGEISQSTNYKWLTRNELESSLPKKYFSSINDFLVDEE